MSRSPRPALAALALAAVLFAAAAEAQTTSRFGYGRTPSPEEIAGWDIDIDAKGRGLPQGRGSVKDGEDLYITHCANCHGEFGEGAGRYPEIAGGKGTLASEDPRKTVGSFWPYATTLFDYIRRTMPFASPQTLTNDELYSITAYVLALNDIVKEDVTLDAASLPKIVMPNARGFISGGDPRPDARNEPCMKNCRNGPVRVTSDLAQRLGLTPTRRSD